MGNANRYAEGLGYGIVAGHFKYTTYPGGCGACLEMRPARFDAAAVLARVAICAIPRFVSLYNYAQALRYTPVQGGLK